MTEVSYKEEGLRELASHVIFKAVVDRYDKPLSLCGCELTNLGCSKNFFKTTWFDDLAEIAGMNSNSMRTSYRNNTKEFRENMAFQISIWKKRS